MHNKKVNTLSEGHQKRFNKQINKIYGEIINAWLQSK